MQDFSDLAAIFIDFICRTFNGYTLLECTWQRANINLEIHVELGPALSIDIYTDYTYTVRGLHNGLKFF